MDVVARLLRTPIVSWLVVIPVVAVCAAQRHLGPRAGVLEAWRHRLCRRVDWLFSLVGGYATYRATTAEYVCSVELPPTTVESHLWRRGHHRNLLAAKKYRRESDGTQWSVASWVYRDEFWAGEQLHVTLFRRPGGVDCYAHREPSPVTNPLDHWLVEDQELGDPNATLRTALDDADVEWFRDEKLVADETEGRSGGRATRLAET